MNRSFRMEQIIEKSRKKEQDRNRKKQYRHEWLIAIFSTIGGAIAGFITSLIFWLITTR